MEARSPRRFAPIALDAREAASPRAMHDALRPRRPALGALAVAVLLVGASGIARAQSSSASYQIPRQSIDGGAQRAASASHVVDATIGQPDAAPVMTSASYELRGGVHRLAAGASLPDQLFRDGFESR